MCTKTNSTYRQANTLTFSTTWFPSHRDIPQMLDIDGRIEHTVGLARDWADQCTYQGPYREVVAAIVAGAASAHPQRDRRHRGGGDDIVAGGLRRRAQLGLSFLLASRRFADVVGADHLPGYVEEAKFWRDWLLRAIAGDPQDLQIMYAVDGGRDLPERELDHLPGYAGSRPVRIGNGAVDQRQSDVLGEVMMALELAREAHGASEAAWELQRTLVDELADHWREPDNGLWEIRGEPQHFTHSRLMVWVAFDRAVQAVETYGLDGPVEKWRAIRDEVREEILAKGFNQDRNIVRPALRHDRSRRFAAVLRVRRVPTGRRPQGAGDDRGDRAGPDARRPGPSLPNPVRRRRARGRRASVSGVFVLAGSCLCPRGTRRRRRGTDGPAGRAGQRCRPLVRGVRPPGTSGWSAISRKRSRT